MWDEIVRLQPGFESVGLTDLDCEGLNVHFRPWVDPNVRLIRIHLPAHASIEAGPASLLCHCHDENLWNPRSFLGRGTLAREVGGWIFEPKKYVSGPESKA